MNYSKIVKITEEEYWQTFPRFWFHRPFFYRWTLKRRHKKFNKKLEKDQKLDTSWNRFLSKIDNYLAYGDENK